MREPVVRSKTRRSIVQAVMSHVKFQSSRIKKRKNIKKKKKKERIQLFQKEIKFPLTIFFKMIIFREKKIKNPCFMKLELS